MDRFCVVHYESTDRGSRTSIYGRQENHSFAPYARDSRSQYSSAHKSSELTGYLVEIWMSMVVVWHSVWCIFFCFFAENTMNFGEALYFGIITSTTVGYRDYSADHHKDVDQFGIRGIPRNSNAHRVERIGDCTSVPG